MIRDNKDKGNILKLVLKDSVTPDDVRKAWQEVLAHTEALGGMESFCVVGIMSDGSTFHYSTGGASYRNMLGAIEHLKLSYFTENRE